MSRWCWVVLVGIELWGLSQSGAALLPETPRISIVDFSLWRRKIYLVVQNPNKSIFSIPEKNLYINLFKSKQDAVPTATLTNEARWDFPPKSITRHELSIDFKTFTSIWNLVPDMIKQNPIPVYFNVKMSLKANLSLGFSYLGLNISNSMLDSIIINPAQGTIFPLISDFYCLIPQDDQVDITNFSFGKVRTIRAVDDKTLWLAFRNQILEMDFVNFTIKTKTEIPEEIDKFYVNTPYIIMETVNKNLYVYDGNVSREWDKKIEAADAQFYMKEGTLYYLMSQVPVMSVGHEAEINLLSFDKQLLLFESGSFYKVAGDSLVDLRSFSSDRVLPRGITDFLYLTPQTMMVLDNLSHCLYRVEFKDINAYHTIALGIYGVPGTTIPWSNSKSAKLLNPVSMTRLNDHLLILDPDQKSIFQVQNFFKEK